MTLRPANDNLYRAGAVVAVRGYRERIAPSSGIKIIEIDFTADPAKDNAAWVEMRRREVGDAMFRREFLRDATVASGDAFYPEFANAGGVEKFGFVAKGIPKGLPVERGWDFGRRKPAIAWGMRLNNRPYLLRELMIVDVSTWIIADLARFMSGQIVEQDMMPEARAAYAQLLDEGEITEGPWFPRGTEFTDYAGPECFAPAAQVKEGDPRTNYDILASKGIYLSAPRVEVMDRVKVMRKLLYVDDKGRPGIKIDTSCKHFIGALAGGLGYESPTSKNPKPVKPRKDGHFDNIHDAVTYWLVQTVPLVDAPAHIKRTVYRNRVPYEVIDDGVEYLFHEGQSERLKRLP